MPGSENANGDAISDVIGQFEKLLRVGIEILQNITLGGLPHILDSWIIEAADRIIPIMPDNITQYPEINEIKKRYQENKILIPSKVLHDVTVVLENLKVAYDCFRLGAIGDYRDIPKENLAAIAYDQIKQTTEYIRKNLVEQLKGKENGRTKRTALLYSYGRIYCWVESIIKLDGLTDFLAVAGCARAILELFVDMHYLYFSDEDLDVERYFSFSDVSKFRTAKNIVDLKIEYDLVDPDKQNPVESFLSDSPEREKTLKLRREKLWGRTKKGKPIQPQHWTNLSMVDRVKKVGGEIIMNTYLQTYYYCNWSVHSGYSDFPGRRVEDVHLYNWHFYNLSNKMFIGSSILINKEAQVIDSQTLRDEFNEIERVAHKRFFGELVKSGRKINKTVEGNNVENENIP